MVQKTLRVPGMYADHHVAAIKDALATLTGVVSAYASSLFRQVTVEYDPSVVTSTDIEERIKATGYVVGDGEDSVAIGSWESSPGFEKGSRVTITNELDLKMTGDFRKY